MSLLYDLTFECTKHLERRFKLCMQNMSMPRAICIQKMYAQKSLAELVQTDMGVCLICEDQASALQAGSCKWKRVGVRHYTASHLMSFAGAKKEFFYFAIKGNDVFLCSANILLCLICFIFSSVLKIKPHLWSALLLESCALCVLGADVESQFGEREKERKETATASNAETGGL